MPTRTNIKPFRASRFRTARSHYTTMPTRTNIKPGPTLTLSELDSMMENISKTERDLKQKNWEEREKLESFQRKRESLKREMDYLKRCLVMDSTGVKDSNLGTVKENEDPDLTSIFVSVMHMNIEQNGLIQEHSKHEKGSKCLNQRGDVLQQLIDHHLKKHPVVKDSDLEIIGDNEDPDDEEDGMSMDTRSLMDYSRTPSTKKKHAGSVPSLERNDHLKKHRVIDHSGVKASDLKIIGDNEDPDDEEDGMSMDTRSLMDYSQTPSTKKQHAGLVPSWKAMGSK
jgi:hypothetical protein